MQDNEIAEAVAEMERICYICEGILTYPCEACTNLTSRDVCEACCEHWACRDCDREYLISTADVSHCESCDSCSRCCDCIECARCDTRRRDMWVCTHGYCENCADRCSGCQEDEDADCDSYDHDDIFVNTGAHFQPKWIYSVCEKCQVAYASSTKTKTTFKHGLKCNKDLKGDMINSPRMMAVELEIDRIEDGDSLRDYIQEIDGAIVTDGSLSRTGFEIKSPVMQGKGFEQVIGRITKLLDQGGYNVNNKCGFHLHVDCRNLDWPSIRRLLLLYNKMEDTIFHLVPSKRRSSNFAEKCGEALSAGLANGKGNIKTQVWHNQYGIDLAQPHSLSQFEDPAILDLRGRLTRMDASIARLYDNREPGHLDTCFSCGNELAQRKAKRASLAEELMTRMHIKQSKKRVIKTRKSQNNKHRRALRSQLTTAMSGKWPGSGIGRYKALNLHSLFYRGSIEIRLHSGTGNKQKIIAWAAFWSSFIDKAQAMSEKTLQFLLRESVSSTDLLWYVMPNDTVREFYANRIKELNGRDVNISARDAINSATNITSRVARYMKESKEVQHSLSYNINQSPSTTATVVTV